MKLNHLDLQVADVQALASFFVDHFGLVRRSNDRSPAIAILDADGFSLVIQRVEGATYPEGFHIGFIQADVAAVTAQHARLIAAGVAVGAIGTNARGTQFYLKAPGDIVVEVSTPR